jgi:hypothetical protein
VCVYVCDQETSTTMRPRPDPWAAATQELKNDEENVNPIRPHSAQFTLKGYRKP